MFHLFLSLSFYHFLVMKINKKRELRNITINHSSDIDYKNFLKIYRECTRKHFKFSTVDTTLSASDP